MNSQRTPLLWLLLPFALGIGLFPTSNPISPTPFLALATLCGVIAIVLLRWKKRWPTLLWATALCISLIFAGMARIAFDFESIRDLEQRPPREAIVLLEVQRYFPSSPDSTRLAGIAKILEVPAHTQQLLDTKIFFSAWNDKLPEIQPKVGDQLRVRGVLALVSTLATTNQDNSFHHYLQSSGTLVALDRGQVLQHTPSESMWANFLQNQKAKLHHILSIGLANQPELAGALQAMMLGEKSELHADQKELYLRSGAMHLFAISGLHIGVVAACIHAILILLRLPQRARPFIALPVLLWFVLVTGATPSALRAFSMIAFLYLGTLLDRQSSPLPALCLSALVALLIDPFQIYSAGFQMSYGAVAMIFLFGLPLLTSLEQFWEPFRFIPKEEWKWHHKRIDEIVKAIIAGFCISLSAALTGNLLGLAYFDLYPMYSILFNVLLIPLAGLAIISGFVSIFWGLLSLDSLSLLFNHSAALLIKAIEHILQTGIQIPGSFLQTENTHQAIAFTVIGIMLAHLLLAYRNKQARKPKAILIRFAPSIALHALGVALLLSIKN